MGWTLPLWMAILSMAWLAHRLWFNTLAVTPLLTGLLVGQGCVLLLWALLLWTVVLDR